ncbi:SNF2 family N-terminal domain-containing protein [Ectothiorhodospira magna]|uniref:SNF2 family N-terminal domain-containing protein n=1 Tax=Ectothiorhodospira magna TaxID=867345 RepID=A0A1H8YVU7_9GAMM|nr:DEAD/DEAH box helicase [Ectothiorhodospira magna]SEP56354.1 SNF2 family N-terminal domain-containing protein [Ectothiorhodospira magna]
MPVNYAPGMRVEIRDAEWRIRMISRTTDGGYLLICEGISELVRGREGHFLTTLESHIRILDPRKTHLIDDLSSGYQASLLYLDTVIRKTPVAGPQIRLGHRAALDPLPFQLEPARQGLSQARCRILIADAVGLGKTLEAGILTAELIARGRGRRILVLTSKSMLAQFQQEFWNRFTIPLVRLDSVGLQRVRNRIPGNHNPFHYFDRAIISIDTLKQDIEYRHHLEQAHWDIIIIDEAHNVAERGGHSQRARLARLLATRSDTLIMLSATPHDGKPRSFASLMNMLDPTAIANPEDYAHEDFRDKGLVIRRFKKDVQDQLGRYQHERDIDRIRIPASAAEEAAHDFLDGLTFHTLDGRPGAGGAQLFRTTLKKALYSSPAACLATLDTRLRRLEKLDPNPDLIQDQDTLRQLRQILQAIDPTHFSKYQRLLTLLGTGPDSLGWQPNDTEDRLVIFTESLRTLDFLQHHLCADLSLKPDQVAVLRGDRPDRELMAIVEDFGRREAPVRLLLCSDVAAEGINLHHLSHRLIHFDIPWSLMVFQQRNGRIDRYGQTRCPRIRYLITAASNPRVQDEQRVLDILIDKDEQAQRNIGDPSEFLGQFDAAEEEATVAEFMEQDSDDLAGLFAQFLDQQQSQSANPLDAFIPDTPATPPPAAAPFSLFEDDFHYATTALNGLRDSGVPLQVDVDPRARRLTLTSPPDLVQRLRHLPPESRPDNDRFILTPVVERIKDGLRRRRDEDSPWAEEHYLWPLHPVMEWLADRALSAFGRHTAPVLRLPAALGPEDTAFLLHGGYPNRRGYLLIQSWIGLVLRAGQVVDTLTLDGFCRRLQLTPGQMANRGQAGPTDTLQAQLPEVVDLALTHLDQHRRREEAHLNHQLNIQMSAMDALKQRHIRQLEQALSASAQADALKTRRRDEGMAHIDRIFKDYEDWLEDTQMIEPQPYIQVIVACTGEET